jgi:predicted phosphoadenosine phosphosulfate sulfurtransferase
MIYKQNNVFEEALERTRFVFDNCDDVIVSMSGGKDSTVLFNIALIVAKERKRLPLKVFWLDQEAEWQATRKYMDKIMAMPEVKPCHFQIPFDFTNSLSHQNNYLRVWDENEKDNWIHKKSDIAIKENPTKYKRVKDLVNWLPASCSEAKHCAVLVGMRISESLHRRSAICQKSSSYKGITWCKKANGNTRVFWNIYDFTNNDIWTAIAKNNWEYNKIYDWQYNWGVSKKKMRVSALIHETSWHAIEMLQEFEPHIYNRFIKRVSGVSCFNHFGKEITVNKLPFAFKDWKEYRDYLLVNLVKEEYWELFKRRWVSQNSDDWYKVHIKELLVNDIDGTINLNAKTNFRIKQKKDNNAYRDVQIKQFVKYMENKND